MLVAEEGCDCAVLGVNPGTEAVDQLGAALQGVGKPLGMIPGYSSAQ
ncbi:hypothetical protein OOT33_00870 [Sphingobium sp. DEHP117]|nr:hypothetical protein [Sphingobium sp. DEHP117]MDQ4419000.1 hypothetical protein [Sphingobium sp. DEHP117]